MPTRDSTRKKIQGLLRNLRAEGVTMLFEQGEIQLSGGIRAALRGQDVYIAPLDTNQTGLFFHYHDVCRRDKQGNSNIRVMSAASSPVVTLEPGITYHCYRSYPSFIPQDVYPLLERGHEFNESYMRQLNSGC